MIADAITLRPAALEDAGVLADLLVQLFNSEAPGVLRGPVADHVCLFRYLVEHELVGGGRYVAADASGQIVGSASLRSPAISGDGMLPPGTLQAAISMIGIGDTLRLFLSAMRASLTTDVSLRPGECYVYSVVVDASARGRGVGEAMMAQLEDAARQMGARAALLRVLVRNETARRLYTRLGYRFVSRTPAALDWIASPTELMRKEL
ncbi:GNAT family N-acetyltransferase [Chloroflexales bacterium ZM16-3]|nr:GNAT family N-acetyltransferase [Chloroflexales bacterium ZM16-3]